MLKRTCRSVIAIALVLLISQASTLSQQAADPQFAVTGTVIGRSVFSGLILLPGDGYHPEVFLLRVDAPSGVLKAGQYIQIRYRYPPSREKELGLPSEFYKRMGQWEFTLTKADAADRKMWDVLYAKQNNKETGGPEIFSLLKRVPGAEKLELPLDAIVPVYEAKIGSARQVCN
jgi:hypothetical protein